MVTSIFNKINLFMEFELYNKFNSQKYICTMAVLTLNIYVTINYITFGMCWFCVHFYFSFTFIIFYDNMWRLISLSIFFVGRRCCKNIKNRVVGWGKVGLLGRGRHDEKIWSQKYSKITWSLHTEWTCVYGDGIHVIRWFEDISFSQVTNYI